MTDLPVAQDWMPTKITGWFQDISATRTKLIRLEDDAMRELDKIVQERLIAAGIQVPVFLSYDLSYWGWDCSDSPIGKCVYDSDEDPAHDECLICGEPEERK